MKLSVPKTILLLLLLFFLSDGYLVVQRFVKAESDVTVVDVFSGDRVQLSSGEEMRILGVSAPKNGTCYALEAKEALKTLVLDKPVRVESVQRDRSGKAMGLLYRGDILVNKLLLEKGFGTAYFVNHETYDLLVSASQLAKTAKVGINSDLCKAVTTY